MDGAGESLGEVCYGKHTSGWAACLFSCTCPEARVQWLPSPAMAVYGKGNVCSLFTLALLCHHPPRFSSFACTSPFSRLPCLFVPCPLAQLSRSSLLLSSPLPPFATTCSLTLHTGLRRALSWLKTPIKQSETLTVIGHFVRRAN